MVRKIWTLDKRSASPKRKEMSVQSVLISHITVARHTKEKEKSGLLSRLFIVSFDKFIVPAVRGVRVIYSYVRTRV